MKKRLLSMTQTQDMLLKELAKQKQITVSELLRRILDGYFAMQAKPNDGEIATHLR